MPSQNWSAYAQAQNNEKLMLMGMLSELSEILQVEEINRVGRPRTDLHEMIFCIAMKTYTRLSSRRLISDLEIANKMEYISHTPHFTTIMKYFGEEEITPVLQELIRLSSLPLKQIETDFAVDSSGFSTSQFGRWFDHKFGEETQRRVYLKSHIMVGVKTNIVASAEITQSSSGDSLQFVPLVKDTSRRFTIKEVSADKAYSAKQNLEEVEKLGAIPYIPFKSNTTGKARGCRIWRKMFDYFKEHRQEFLEHYHKRSNVESTFNMLKQKLGSSLMTKRFTAQKNELLAKILVHNLLVLIQEYFEQGLEVNLSTEAQKVGVINVMW
ncbi:MAG: IS5 family transposase [Candidatus Diapherotrites archaeon]|nr:IS5 family transposase [Candidatus Diapherotrites archaeon]